MTGARDFLDFFDTTDTVTDSMEDFFSSPPSRVSSPGSLSVENNTILTSVPPENDSSIVSMAPEKEYRLDSSLMAHAAVADCVSTDEIFATERFPSGNILVNERVLNEQRYQGDGLAAYPHSLNTQTIRSNVRVGKDSGELITRLHSLDGQVKEYAMMM